MDKLCVQYGFCGCSGHAPFNASRTGWTADEFAFEVLRAEGLDPLMIEGIGPSQSEYFVSLRRLFVARFGNAVTVCDLEV